MENPILVLCIDRDNDLYEKAKIHGPFIGREDNIKAATKLALVDAEDSDVNAIFFAVKIFDEIKNEKNAVIATLTGNKILGHVADLEIAKQLDKVLEETSAERCIFISDGASDEEIIPIIKSRIKIDSVKVVVIKQAKELEKTYFVILEKLKDPYYSKIILGVPAILIFMFSIASLFGFGWQPIGIIVGLYLLGKGFGLDNYLSHILQEFRFSIDKTSWIAYIAAIALFAVSLFVMYQAYNKSIAEQIYNEKAFAYVLRSGLLIVPWAMLCILVGKAFDARSEKRKFVITMYGLYGSAIVLTTMMLKIGSDWTLNREPPYVTFSDFLTTILISIVVGYAVIQIIKIIREDVLSEMKLDGKEVIEEGGTYIGKVIGVDLKNSLIVVQTQFERKTNVALDDIVSIAEKVMIKR
ncbi:MAG: DUF373 family protein [Candidatus Micrarchaeota archaeon]